MQTEVIRRSCWVAVDKTAFDGIYPDDRQLALRPTWPCAIAFSLSLSPTTTTSHRSLTTSPGTSRGSRYSRYVLHSQYDLWLKNLRTHRWTYAISLAKLSVAIFTILFLGIFKIHHNCSDINSTRSERTALILLKSNFATEGARLPISGRIQRTPTNSLDKNCHMHTQSATEGNTVRSM